MNTCPNNNCVLAVLDLNSQSILILTHERFNCVEQNSHLIWHILHIHQLLISKSYTYIINRSLLNTTFTDSVHCLCCWLNELRNSNVRKFKMIKSVSYYLRAKVNNQHATHNFISFIYSVCLSYDRSIDFSTVPSPQSRI